ncbi:MAG: trypsin-like peptidase domain-containing protein, partial [Planctomycetota bacterium]
QTHQIDFVRELVPRSSVPLRIQRPEMIHPHWDMALLRVKDKITDRPPLVFASEHADDMLDRQVVTIGYPGYDPVASYAVNREVFGGRFNIKRLQPGLLRGRKEISDYYHNRCFTLLHDCSTLGGNSGSPIIDIQTGRVVGLHFAGQYMVTNYAVPSFELARDPRIVDAGITFDGSLPATSEWDEKWKSADHPVSISIPEGFRIAPEAKSDTDPKDEAALRRALTDHDPSSLCDPQRHFTGALTAAVASYLAYRNRNRIRDVLMNHGFRDAEIIDVGSTRAFVAVTDQITMIAFRGTDNSSNWALNIRALQYRLPMGYVHTGCYGGFLSLRDPIQDVVRRLGGETNPVVISGHSLGGAMGIIGATLWQADETYDIHAIHTFGQPSVGDINFATHANTVFQNRYFRFVNDDDFVATIPPGYYHFGHLFHFNDDGSLPPVAELAGSESGIPGIPLSNIAESTLSEEQYRRLQEQIIAARDETAVPINNAATPTNATNADNSLDSVSHTMGQVEAPIGSANSFGMGTAGGMTPEGWFDLFSDHKMRHYMRMIQDQIR